MTKSPILDKRIDFRTKIDVQVLSFLDSAVGSRRVLEERRDGKCLNTQCSRQTLSFQMKVRKLVRNVDVLSHLISA